MRYFAMRRINRQCAHEFSACQIGNAISPPPRGLPWCLWPPRWVPSAMTWPQRALTAGHDARGDPSAPSDHVAFHWRSVKVRRIIVSYSDAVMSAIPDSHMLPTAHEPKLGPTCLRHRHHAQFLIYISYQAHQECLITPPLGLTKGGSGRNPARRTVLCVRFRLALFSLPRGVLGGAPLCSVL